MELDPEIQIFLFGIAVIFDLIAAVGILYLSYVWLFEPYLLII